MRCLPPLSTILLVPGSAILLALLPAPGPRSRAADCNQNGVEDSIEVRSGAAPDCNRNGRPDPCDLLPVSGDLEPSGSISTSLRDASPVLKLALADVNGDGRLDAFVSHEGAGEVEVYIGGLAGFAPGPAPVRVESGTFIFAFSAADLTGDGLADLAFITRGPGAQVLELRRNTGDGFAAAEILPGPGLSTSALVAEDLDQDGFREVIEAAHTEVRIHWNDAGSFGEPMVLRHGLSGYLFAALDVEGDGDLDLLAAATRWTAAFLLRNRAPRSFESERHDLPVAPDRLVAGELNGAPGSDLLVLDISGDLAFVGFEAGEFRTFARLDARPAMDSIAAEMDGDGIADAILLHPGSPCAVEASWIEVLRSSEGRLPQARAASVPGQARAAAAGDLDGDGDLDLAVLASPAYGEATQLFSLENRALPTSRDEDSDGIPDECTGSDCNWNGSPDRLDVEAGASTDCDGDLVPDECEPDCNANGNPDDCDVLRGEHPDLDGNGVPDECESSPGDCNLNGIADALDIESGLGDCDGDGLLDSCEAQPEILLSADHVGRVGLRSRPGAAVAADLDGDGDLDVALGGRANCCGEAPAGGVAEILLNAGKGRLVEAGVLALHGDPLELSAGDFELDDDLDIIVLEGSTPCRPEARASVLLNRGRGTFDRGPDAVLPPGSASFATGDLDGKDGMDIAVASPNAEGGCVLLLASDGAGGFSVSEAGPPGGAIAMARGDWNGDGVTDLAASSASRSAIFVLLGQGGGRFASAREIAGEGDLTRDLAVSDLDADGNLDLLSVEAASSSDSARLRLLAGDGTGQFVMLLPLYLEAHPSSLVVQDVDGDRSPDLLVLQPLFSRDYVAERGRLLAFGLDAARAFITLEGWSTAGAYIGVDTPTAVGGDWDEDGLNDLLVADPERRTAAVLRNSGAPSRFFIATHVDVGQEALELDAADLDGDSDPDIVAIDAMTGQLWVGMNDHGTISERPNSVDILDARALSTGDLDGDGDADLALARAFEVAVFESIGGGSFAAPRSLRVGSNPIDVTLADLDGDGDLDVATANRLNSAPLSDNLSVIRNAGNWQFEGARNYATSQQSLAIEAADMDGDGDVDLLVSDVGVLLLRNDGNGAFSQGERLTSSFAFAAAVSGDVDGDGDRDLITNTDGLMLLRNRGDGRLLEPESVQPFWRRVVKLADMDLDGDVDLLFLEGYGPHWLQLLRNDGRGVFAAPATFDAGQAFPPLSVGDGGGGSGSSPAASVIAPADFDGDGDLDLALGFTARSWITIAWNRTRAAELDADRDGVPDSCGEPEARFRRGDVDGSGTFQITDAVGLLQSLFATGDALPCEKAADANDDGRLNVTDALRILGRLFLGDGPLPAPHPDCGLDSSDDDLACSSGGSCG